MQANCCIFPAPKQFQLSKILNKIILIPKAPPPPPNNQSQHQSSNVHIQYYADKYILNVVNQDNQFMRYVGRRNCRMGIGGSIGGVAQGTIGGIIGGLGGVGGVGGNSRVGNVDVTEDTEIMRNGNRKFEIYSSLKQKNRKQTTTLTQTNPLLLHQKLLNSPPQKTSTQIPCIFLPSPRPDRTQKILIFFHGNGEDLTTSYDFGHFICNQIGIAVLIVEYQGYTVYQGDACSEAIIGDARIVVEFLFRVGYQAKDVVLFGRSIGGAFAFETASHFQPCCLILLSPFLSLKKVTEDLYGKCASTLLKQTLDNSSTAQNVKCPILIIHGMKDTLVPYHHSISILKQCKGYTRLKLVQHMTHVKFNFRYDFVKPVLGFFGDLGIFAMG